MARVLILHEAPLVRRRIQEALALEQAQGTAHEVFFARSWLDLRDAARRSACALAIVDPYYGGVLRDVALQRLVRELPSLPLIVYGDFSGRPAWEVVRLADLRPVRVVSLGIDDQPVTVQAAIVEAVGRERLNREVAKLASRLGAHAAPLFMQVVERAGAPRGSTVGEIAAAVGLERRTLERRLGEVGLPPPGRLIMWCRFLHAARLLEDPARSVENVAFALGFGSASALSTAFKRYTDLRATELRASAPVRTLADRFLRSLPGTARRR